MFKIHIIHVQHTLQMPTTQPLVGLVNTLYEQKQSHPTLRSSHMQNQLNSKLKLTPSGMIISFATWHPGATSYCRKMGRALYADSAFLQGNHFILSGGTGFFPQVWSCQSFSAAVKFLHEGSLSSNLPWGFCAMKYSCLFFKADTQLNKS